MEGKWNKWNLMLPVCLTWRWTKTVARRLSIAAHSWGVAGRVWIPKNKRQMNRNMNTGTLSCFFFCSKCFPTKSWLAPRPIYLGSTPNFALGFVGIINIGFWKSVSGLQGKVVEELRSPSLYCNRALHHGVYFFCYILYKTSQFADVGGISSRAVERAQWNLIHEWQTRWWKKRPETTFFSARLFIRKLV